MKTIVINGKTVVAKALTFNDFCTLEDMGIDIQSIESKPMSFVRVYLALCTKSTLEQAGTEIEEHLTNGGELDGLMNAMSDAITDSGFFRSQQTGAEKETPTVSSKKK